MTVSAHEDYQSLDKDSRHWLTELAREPLSWSYARTKPFGLGALVAQGLAFQSHYAVTITPKGREVLDRVA